MHTSKTKHSLNEALIEVNILNSPHIEVLNRFREDTMLKFNSIIGYMIISILINMGAFPRSAPPNLGPTT
jgi:hypothetical protein